MRTRNNVVAGEPFRLHQFIFDSLTRAGSTLDAPPTVQIYNVNPRKVQSATPVATPTVEQLVVEVTAETTEDNENLWFTDGSTPDPNMGQYGDFFLDETTGNFYRRVLVPGSTPVADGAYKVELTLLTPGWYWDRWTAVIGGKTFVHESSFYVSPAMPVIFSDWPGQAPQFLVRLLTPRMIIGSTQWIRFKVQPLNCPTPSVRLVCGNAVIFPWTNNVTFDASGNMAWLVNFDNPAITEGVYTIEAKLALGRELLTSAPMYLKIEHPSDYETQA